MKAKHFFTAVIVSTLVCFGALILLLSTVDPFFVLHGLDEDDTARFNNQRYQMAGLIRHQDYSVVLMGTSLVANYRSSWFTDGLGEETLKITFPNGWVSEFDTALQLAFRTHPKLDKVFFCFDPNILIRSDSERTVELPGYLYNLNPLDDVEYLLNADTYQEAMRSWLRRDSGEMVTLDEAYAWDRTYAFSKAKALVSYPRPEISDTVLPSDAYLDVAEENLTVVRGWIEQHPDVEFVLWFPPYSMLYWDKVTREGTRNAILTAIEYVAGELLEYDNVALYSFLYSRAITDLNNYTDHIHCSGAVTRRVANCLLTGEGLMTREDYRQRLQQLRDYVEGYDYEVLFK